MFPIIALEQPPTPNHMIYVGSIFQFHSSIKEEENLNREKRSGKQMSGGEANFDSDSFVGSANFESPRKVVSGKALI